MGDLSELMASIAERASSSARGEAARHAVSDRRRERRYQAAVQVGVRDVPVSSELDDTEVIEIALVENLQRKDLTPFEEAEALQALAERCGYTHEDLPGVSGSPGRQSPSPCR